MAEINLTQTEADKLIAMEKHRATEEQYDFPILGASLAVPLHSPDKHEHFSLDIYRGRLDLLKGKFQNRSRQVIVLVRLDFGGSPHRNPDGEEIACPHLHLFREGFGDKWAVPAPVDSFSQTSDLWETLGDFMRYCKITIAPDIRRGIFT